MTANVCSRSSGVMSAASTMLVPDESLSRPRTRLIRDETDGRIRARLFCMVVVRDFIELGYQRGKTALVGVEESRLVLRGLLAAPATFSLRRGRGGGRRSRGDRDGFLLCDRERLRLSPKFGDRDRLGRRLRGG